eukprot:s976_g17.t3
MAPECAIELLPLGAAGYRLDFCEWPVPRPPAYSYNNVYPEHGTKVGMNSMVQEFGPATEFGDTEDAECGRFILKADPVLFYQAMAAEDLLVQKIKEHFVRKDNGFEVDLVDNMELEEATQLCEV